jgi:hypothetical protein
MCQAVQDVTPPRSLEHIEQSENVQSCGTAVLLVFDGVLKSVQLESQLMNTVVSSSGYFVSNFHSNRANTALARGVRSAVTVCGAEERRDITVARGSCTTLIFLRFA